jgi:ABC-type sugar transport system ATPase subunit
LIVGAAALRLEGITKIYPGTIALDGVDIEVRRGEVHGLIGKNGAGKSTLVGIMAGLVQPTSGVIEINGLRYHSLTRARAKEGGIAIVTQEPEVILDITVAENLFLGGYSASGGLVNWRELNRKAADFLSRYGLDIAPDYRAGDMSLSERQLLLILKACVVDNADIIILDESSAPLSPKDAVLLRDMVYELRDAGRAIIYISHQIDELLEVCDKLTVLRDGRSVATENKSGLTCQTLSELIIGESLSPGGLRREAAVSDETLLCLSGFTKWGVFEDVNLSLDRGEILGIAGLRGSGRTELLKAIAGIDPPDEGTMTFKGRECLFRKPSQALQAGIAYLPEEREAEGLIKGFSISDNLTLNCLGELSSHGVIRQAERASRARSIFDAVECKAFSTDQDVDELSGGNKQKVLIGRIMAVKPDVYLLDEPTKGVDVGAKRGILSIVMGNIRGLAGVLVTSPGLDDLMEICDRILILYKGRIVASYDRPDFDEKTLFMDIQGITVSREVSSCLSV